MSQIIEQGLVERVFQELAERAVREFVGSEGRWASGAIEKALSDEAVKLIKTPEIQELIRQRVTEIINNSKLK